MFTFVVVAEITEVSGAGYCDHFSDASGGPTRDDVPHALAACQRETITWRITQTVGDTHTRHNDRNKSPA